MKEVKKNRISSFVPFIGSIFFGIFGILLLPLLVFIYNLKDELETTDYIMTTITVLTFVFIGIFISLKARLMFIDENYLYLKGVFYTQKIHRSDILKVYSKRFFPVNSKNYVIEYLNKNLKVKKIEIVPKSFNNEAFLSFKERYK